MKQIETQMTQLANVIGSQHKLKQFLSDTTLNLKNQYNAIQLRHEPK